jgi:hypothetical protein
MLWKFLTDGAYDDDYGGTESQTLALTSDPFPTFVVSGTGTALKGTVPSELAGLVVCTLVEKGDNTGTFRFEKLGGSGGVFSSTEDGTFSFRDLVPGTYNLEIRAPGYDARRLEGFTVTREPTDLGVISMASNAGTIAGSVAFEDNPVPAPSATVQLRAAGQGTVLQSTSTSGSFSFANVAVGNYDVVFRATDYRDTVRAGVAVANGQTTNLGVTVMRRRPVGPSITVDGSLDAGYGPALAVQAVQTGFGDNDLGLVGDANGSELDVAHALIANGQLYVFLGGNLESNFNKLDLFVDTRAGEGQNRLRGDNPDADLNGLNRLGDDGSGNGLRFDTGFDADYFVTLSMGDGGTGSVLIYASFAEILTAGGGGTGRYLGQTAPGSDGTLTGGVNPDGIRLTVDNRNTAGVGAGSAAASGAGVTTGIEIAIPLSAIGDPTGCVRLAVFIAGGGHDFVSNQVLGPLEPPAGNLAEPRLVDFTTQAGTQHFEVCPAGAPGRWSARPWSVRSGRRGGLAR